MEGGREEGAWGGRVLARRRCRWWLGGRADLTHQEEKEDEIE
jgi:hypothetical protein